MVSDVLMDSVLSKMPIGQVMTMRDLIKATNKDEGNLRRILKAMIKLGLVEKVPLDRDGKMAKRFTVGYKRSVSERSNTDL